ncbi:hypothetical protein HK101_009537 [Irineochytrium annulatum]|nr:hypothetical protein HK101_009537 [Irineochytrium annulatum]
MPPSDSPVNQPALAARDPDPPQAVDPIPNAPNVIKPAQPPSPPQQQPINPSPPAASPIDDPSLIPSPPSNPDNINADPIAPLAHELGLSDADIAHLSPEQRHVLEDRKHFLDEHRGHEKQHAQMALILIGGLVVFQLLLLAWKRLRPRSFQLASLLGLWVVPPAIGLSLGNYRYLMTWCLFSVANAFVVRRALFETPMQSSTPRLVYRWYSYVYSASVAVGGFGYFVVLVTFFHIPYALMGFSEKTELSMFQHFKGGVVILFYGLYFGTLGRDFVDSLSDRMAVRTGYFNRTGFPKKHLRPNVCAICGDSTDAGYRGRHGAVKLLKLGCDHTYHEECIRGWTIVGKKDCCPYCKEKVDLKAFSKHAWDTTQILYLNLLDALRYLIVWNPILFLMLHFIFNVLGYS